MIGVTWLDPTKFIRAGRLCSRARRHSAWCRPTAFSGKYQLWRFLKVLRRPSPDFNAGLDKDFGICETLKLNFHAETFNVLNHTVLNLPGYNNTVGPDTQGFGIISSANDIQLSFHVIF